MFATTADGVSIWWEHIGHGPAVVLIPGRGDSADLFPKLLVDGLVTAGASVVRMDPRDTGLSGDGGDGYTLSTLAADIVAVLDAADVERAHTVAVSMGGMVTVDLVSRFGHRVLSSTFIAAMSVSGGQNFINLATLTGLRSWCTERLIDCFPSPTAKLSRAGLPGATSTSSKQWDTSRRDASGNRSQDLCRAGSPTEQEPSPHAVCLGALRRWRRSTTPVPRQFDQLPESTQRARRESRWTGF